MFTLLFIAGLVKKDVGQHEEFLLDWRSLLKLPWTVAGIVTVALHLEEPFYNTTNPVQINSIKQLIRCTQRAATMWPAAKRVVERIFGLR